MAFTIPPSAPVVNALAYEAVILDRRTASAISPDHIGEAIKQLAYDLDVALRSGSASARAVALDLLQYERDNQPLVGRLDQGMDEKMAQKAKTARGVTGIAANPAPPPPTHTVACEECGATFRHVPGRRYCSRACSKRGWNKDNWRRYKTERPSVASRPCVVCGNEFTPLRDHKLLCSPECRLVRRREHERRRNMEKVEPEKISHDNV